MNAGLLQETERALDGLDLTESRKYLKAKEMVPNVVVSETPISRFLRTDDNNPTLSAKRLALYWKYRKEIFGERWLLPMVQTGRGALTRNDIIFVRSGFYVAYPFKEFLVLCFDLSKLTSFMEQSKLYGWDDDAIHSRAAFYMATILSQLPVCQEKGIVVIHIINSQKRPAVPFRNRIWEIIRTAMPCKMNKIVVAQAYEQHKQELLDFLRYQTTTIVRHTSKLRIEQVHGSSVSQILQGLSNSFGLSPTLAPVPLGGKLDLDATLAEWTRTRLSLEEFATVSPTSSDVPLRRNPFAVMTPRVDQTGQLITRRKNETELTFQKRRAALYARRTYQKRKNLNLSLQEQLRTIQEQNKLLRQESRRLENLLFQAQEIVEGVSIMGR